MSINPIVWLFALLCTLLSPFSIGQSTIIHEQKSLYQDIVVFEHQDFRCLSFTAKKENESKPANTKTRKINVSTFPMCE